MTAIELNNRKQNLISKILKLDNEDTILKIEKVLNKEGRIIASPIAFTLDELKHEISEAEKEELIISQEDLKNMRWEK